MYNWVHHENLSNVEFFFFMRKKHPLSWDSPKGETSYIVTAYKIGHTMEKIQLKTKDNRLH